MILTDGHHLVSDESVDELHQFAQHIGLSRGWFQDHPDHPHYDLFGRAHSRAVQAGAQHMPSKQLVRRLKKR
ncbi:MAG: DUF4031 domain-containing protein [Candidatus Omnitrophota bacterium]|jgi:hypothetical protein